MILFEVNCSYFKPKTNKKKKKKLFELTRNPFILYNLGNGGDSSQPRTPQGVSTTC